MRKTTGTSSTSRTRSWTRKPFRPLEGPYASDGQRVYWMGKPIDGADPATFVVLNSDFECSADQQHAYYRQTVIANADPRSFPPGRAVTRCDETSISFAD